jgi:hypothetical protein
VVGQQFAAIGRAAAPPAARASARRPPIAPRVAAND